MNGVRVYCFQLEYSILHLRYRIQYTVYNTQYTKDNLTTDC